MFRRVLDESPMLSTSKHSGRRHLPFLARFAFRHWPEENDEPDLSEEDARKRRTWILSVAVVVFFILGYVMVNGLGVRFPARASADSPGEPAPEAVTYPAELRAQIETLIGSATSHGSSKIRRVTLEGRNPAYPVVSLVADQGDDILAEAKIVFGILFAEDRTQLATLYVSHRVPWVFGTSRMKRVFMAKVSRSTFDALDWDSLTPRDLPGIADYVFSVAAIE